MSRLLGVDLGGTRVRAALVEGAQVVDKAERRISALESVDTILGEIYEVMDRVFDPAVRGIGIGVPSIVDRETGVVFEVANIPSWTEVPLRELLGERYGRPVCVDNDANAFVVGELYFGEGQGARDLVGVTLGTGMGVGVVLDHGLRRGRNCGVGELGMMPYGSGLLEHYCSGQFFARASTTRGEELLARADAGDPATLELYRTFGAELGHGLQVVLYAYDPEKIVLGGSISRAHAHFVDSMTEALSSFTYERALEHLEVVPSQSEDIAVLGAAALFLDRERSSREPANEPVMTEER